MIPRRPRSECHSVSTDAVRSRPVPTGCGTDMARNLALAYAAFSCEYSSVGRQRRATCGTPGDRDSATSTVDARRRLGARHWLRAVMRLRLEGEQSAQLPGGVPAVDAGASDELSCLLVRPFPSATEVHPGDGIGGVDASVDGSTRCGVEVSDLKRVLSRTEVLLGLPTVCCGIRSRNGDAVFTSHVGSPPCRRAQWRLGESLSTVTPSPVAAGPRSVEMGSFP